MYAVINNGGKQYQVRVGQTIRIEKVELPKGETLEFNEVLLISKSDGEIIVGSSTISGAKVTAEVVDQGRADKINIIKMKRRKHHMKHQGHRQWFTEVKITDIKAA